jgi:L,D-transpeptidase catalytic domain
VRAKCLLIPSLALGLAAAMPAYAQQSTPPAAGQPPPGQPAPPLPPPEQRVIPPGVWAGGVELSNMTVAQAAVALRAALRPRLGRPVTVRVAGRRFTITARGVRQRFDPLRTAKRAYRAGLHTPPPPPPGAGGASPPVLVALAVSHRRLVVRAFAQRVARVVYRPARDATVQITVRHVYRRHSRPGHALGPRGLAAAIDRAFEDPTAPTLVRPRLRRVPPAVTAEELARVYGTILTIDRDHFHLRLFKRLRFSRSYPIAVGMAGLETPAGLYAIRDKQVNPAWHVPNRAWAGSLAGQVIPGGAPNNPLKARWLGIANGVGIHGTAEDWSIGTRASHGCIRMHVSDVIDLFGRVPLGTPVLIR